jgi:hypothetical protein
MPGSGDEPPYGGGFEQVGTNVDPPRALRDDSDLEPGAERSLEANIDVVLVPWTGVRPAPGAGEAPWHYVQLWTAKRIYAFDMAMTCVDVIDRETGSRQGDPQMVGAHLTGGQLIVGGTVKMVYPLPVPGTQAVLEASSAGKQAFVRTPPLERVLVRLVAVGATPREEHPTWESVASWQSEARDTTPPR